MDGVPAFCSGHSICIAAMLRSGRMLCSVVCTPLIRSDVVVVFVNFCWNSIVDVVGTRRAYRFASLHPPYLCPVRNQNVLSFMFSNLLLCVCVCEEMTLYSK